MNNIINPDDRDYYYGKLYEVGIWPGAGYQLVTFKVYAANEQEALELVVADAELHNENLLMSIPEMENYIAEDWSEECNKFMQENEDRDADEYTFAEEYLNYIYVDATMQGASQPYFINGENLVINEISENNEVKESKEVKEELFNNDINLNVSTGDISSNLDLGGLGALTGLVASEEEKECQDKLVEDTGSEEHIIWDSEIDYYDEEYMNEVKENQYQDYLDNFEPGEPLSFEDWVMSDECYDTHYHWFEDSGVTEWTDLVDTYKDEFKEDYDEYVANYKDEPLPFDKWYNDYIEESSYDDWNILKEDLEDNILPSIERQMNYNCLILSGYYGSNYPDFRSSGNGGKMFEGVDEFKDYMGGFDRTIITTQGGILGSSLYDHDGTVSGEFYTLPENLTELVKAMNYETYVDIPEDITDEQDILDTVMDQFEEDLVYGNVDVRDLTEHIDLLVPIKDTISGYTPDPEPKKENKEITIENAPIKSVTEAVEYISRKEYDEMPEDYKTTIAKTLQARQAVGDNVDELKNLYKNLGYEETDPMIMVNDNGGTILKPVKIQEEKEITLDGEDLTNTFKNYKAFEANFEPIKIVKNSYDKNYKVYRVDEEDANNYIYYSNNKDNIEGWLYGAVQAANGVSKKLTNKNENVNKSSLNEEDEETLDEAINRAHQEEISAIDTYDTVLSKTDETTDTKLVDMIEEIKADEEDHKLLLQHYIETGEALTDDELKELKDKSSEEDTEVIEENKKENNAALEIAQVHFADDQIDEFKALDRDKQFDKVFNYLDTVEYDFCSEVEDKEKPEMVNITIKELESLKAEYPEKAEQIDKSINKFNKLKDTKKESKLVEENSTITEELNTGVLPIVAVDMYSLSDSLNEYDISQEDLDEIVQELAPKYIEDTLREILPNVSVVTKSVYHPKQYNFEGDELEFSLTVDKQAYETLKENALNNPEFETFLKDNYSTRDGFISAMAYNLDKFKQQPEWKQMVQVIMFNVSDDKIQENNEHYVDEFLERVSMTAGPAIDESKSLTEDNNEEPEFDPSNEVDDEAMNTEFKVGDVVADIVDGDIAIVEALPDTDDGTYTLRFVTGVCKGDAYQYKKGRFTIVTHEDIRKEALEIYNDNMKPEDNPLKKENLAKKEETVNKTFAEFKKNN